MAKRRRDPSERRARWLLAFVGRDLEAARSGELLDLRDDMLRFRSGSDAVDTLSPAEAKALVEGGEVSGVDGATRVMLADLQKRLRRGIATLESKGRWSLRSPDRYDLVMNEGRLERHYRGGLTAVFLSTAADVLVGCWPQLRHCALASCRALFLPTHGHQCYHSPKCSNTERQARFRDYGQEKERRVLHNGPGRGRGKRRKR